MTDAILETRPPRAVADDTVLPFAVEALDVRGRVVHLGPELDRILGRHDYPAPVSRLLGEAVVLTSLLGSSLKFEGRFILQTRTDGPVSMIVVDFATPDAIRAYASFDADAVAAAIAAGKASSPDLLGRGQLAMTVDQGGDMSRYQGVVPLDGGSTFEDVAHTYFRQSEQIPTRVRLAVAEMLTRTPGGAPVHGWRAGGLIVQFLPESEDRVRRRDLDPGDGPEGTATPVLDDDDAWMEARSLVDTVEDIELTDPEVSHERLLFRLFHERGVRVFDALALKDQCRCSRERVQGMLEQFSAEDVSEMTVDGEIVVTCEFCSTHYRFDPATLVKG
ncbi:Hsp33 family molecular chaperone [Methyloraptor flagellatus]|uniref:Hsp33 family molecular chaperone n=1 Tax=Methyloraptor flagellatus TaxID=3162530 RepID=A0AAU7X9H7_9HYPH